MCDGCSVLGGFLFLFGLWVDWCGGWSVGEWCLLVVGVGIDVRCVVGCCGGGWEGGVRGCVLLVDGGVWREGCGMMWRCLGKLGFLLWMY